MSGFFLLRLYNFLKQDHTDSISTTESQHTCPRGGIGPMITSMWGTQHANVRFGSLEFTWIYVEFTEDPTYTTSHPNDHYRQTSKAFLNFGAFFPRLVESDFVAPGWRKGWHGKCMGNYGRRFCSQLQHFNVKTCQNAGSWIRWLDFQLLNRFEYHGNWNWNNVSLISLARRCSMLNELNELPTQLFRNLWR